MRINSLTAMLMCVAALTVFATSGCDDTSKPADKDAAGDHGHDHDHEDHDDSHSDEKEHAAHGPNHGHVFSLDADNVKGEWVKYPDNDTIRMFILDEKDANAPLKVDSFMVTPKVGADAEGFALEADSPNEAGESASYSLDDKELSIAIPMGVDIEIKVGDKTYKGEIKAHKPLDH